MKTSDDLFQLIKSLDQSEKRYFRLFSSTHNKAGESNNYVKLFDAIDKQSEYDETKLKQSLNDEKLIKQLHVLKNYLYNNILKSLRLYNSEKTKANELAGYVRDIENLYDKSLFHQCRKMIDKAKKIAVKYERFVELLEILNYEKILARSEAYADSTEKELEELHKDHKNAEEKLNNINDYWLLNIKSFFIRKKRGSLSTETELKEYNNLMQHPLMQDESRALSYIAKNFYYNLKGLFYLTNQDYENLYRYCKEQIDFMESMPHLLKKDNYINSLNNLLLVQIELKKYNEAFETISKLRNIDTDSLNYKAMIFVNSYDTELNIYLRTGEFEKGVGLINEINNGFNEYRKVIDKEMQLMFYYNISYLLFGSKKYDEALEWINKILNAKEMDLREDIHCFARILNLFIHYELKNYDLIEYIIRSTQRYLSVHKSLRELESSILSHIKKLITAADAKKRNKLLDDMKFEIEKYGGDVTASKAFEFFDFSSWIESKMDGIDFKNAVKNKNLKQAAS